MEWTREGERGEVRGAKTSRLGSSSSGGCGPCMVCSIPVHSSTVAIVVVVVVGVALGWLAPPRSLHGCPSRWPYPLVAVARGTWL